MYVKLWNIFNDGFGDNIGDVRGKKHILLYLSSYNTLIFLDLFCYKNLKCTGLFSSGKK